MKYRDASIGSRQVYFDKMILQVRTKGSSIKATPRDTVYLATREAHPK